MTSKELQHKFNSIYCDFFSRCSQVVSAPHSFLWSGDFSGFYGGLTISSKIPLRFYVGIEETGSENLEVNSKFFAYFADKDSFEQMSLSDQLQKAIISQFRNIGGKKIHLLSEVPLGSSLGGLGAISACLAILITEGQRNKKTKEQINKPAHQNISLFPKAWQIAKQLQTGRTLGATAYVALSESSYPIAFYAESTKYWAKPLDQIVKLAKNPIWPIDFGLIYSGKLVQGAAVVASAEEIKRISEERETKLDFRRISTNPFWIDYINFLKQVTSQNLYAMCDLLQKGSHESSQKFFFNTLNQYQNMLHFLEISNPEIDRIYGKIHNIANAQNNRVGSGAKITGVGKGGMVLFALPYGEYREELEKEFEHNLIYASWRDGTDSQSTILEQDIGADKLSEFINKGAYKLTVYSKLGVSRRIVSEELLIKSDLDLIVDIYHKKILIPGKEIGSKDLPSQKSAAIILFDLFQSPNNTLSNSELPKSYASSRFDLQSKITSPVSKLCNIDFEISGSIYDNFSLKIKNIGGKIGIIEKI